MTSSGIIAQNVSKKFRRGELHDSLRDLVPALTKRLFRNGRAASQLEEDDFWALRDVSFEVNPGQALGIIGPNGAGKSTMLKLLTRILRPTTGWIELRGRAGALIEIAAGFHPDLTGRENIFLQGAIMGMRKAEIEERFDRIVEFSGIPDFIDTPVKRYSSGMNARLGFAIAAHLEPDVLIIDEVLAVGDFAFQGKAFGRIQELATRGTPVVVVSHQLERIASLCTEAILLDRGRVAYHGTPRDCIAHYVFRERDEGFRGDSDAPLRIHSAELVSPQPVISGGPIHLKIRGATTGHYEAETHALVLRVRAMHTGQVVFASMSSRQGVEFPSSGPFELDVGLDMNLAPGLYSVESVARDLARKRLIGSGPSLTVHVKGGPSFRGLAQLHARMEVAESRDDADDTRHARDHEPGP